MRRQWTRPGMRIGEVWAWRSSVGRQLERVRLTDVGDVLRVHAVLLGAAYEPEVVDRAVTFWCPWSQLDEYLEMRVEVATRLAAARMGVSIGPSGHAEPTAVAVRAPGGEVQRTAYTLEAAAAECGVSPEFLRAFVNRNDLVVHYANSKMIILPEDLRDWIKSLPQERR